MSWNELLKDLILSVLDYVSCTTAPVINRYWTITVGDSLGFWSRDTRCQYVSDNSTLPVPLGHLHACRRWKLNHYYNERTHDTIANILNLSNCQYLTLHVWDFSYRQFSTAFRASNLQSLELTCIHFEPASPPLPLSSIEPIFPQLRRLVLKLDAQGLLFLALLLRSCDCAKLVELQINLLQHDFLNNRNLFDIIVQCLCKMINLQTFSGNLFYDTDLKSPQLAGLCNAWSSLTAITIWTNTSTGWRPPALENLIPLAILGRCPLIRLQCHSQTHLVLHWLSSFIQPTSRFANIQELSLLDGSLVYEPLSVWESALFHLPNIAKFQCTTDLNSATYYSCNRLFELFAKYWYRTLQCLRWHTRTLEWFDGSSVGNILSTCTRLNSISITQCFRPKEQYCNVSRVISSMHSLIAPLTASLRHLAFGCSKCNDTQQRLHLEEWQPVHRALACMFPNISVQILIDT